jgi:hypothetical protein
MRTEAARIKTEDAHVTTEGAPTPKTARARLAITLAVAIRAVVCMVSPSAGLSTVGTFASPPLPTAAIHYACSTPNSAKLACHFSTPSGNIRCLWTPKPNNVACVLLASKRAYRLRPTGKAKAIKLRLARRGQTLPTSQQIVFPQSLSCHDTKTTMTCNQDFGLGEFKLAPDGSRGQ